jgi:hypothetical protein
MKYLLAIVVCLSLLFVSNVSYTGQLSSRGAPYPPAAVNTLLSAKTATGNWPSATTGLGTAVNLGSPAAKHTCVITLGGTAPLTVNVDFLGSMDGTNYAIFANHTYTIATTDSQAFVLWYPLQYINANYRTKTGGAADTAVTLTCVSIAAD